MRTQGLSPAAGVGTNDILVPSRSAFAGVQRIRRRAKASKRSFPIRDGERGESRFGRDAHRLCRSSDARSIRLTAARRQENLFER